MLQITFDNIHGDGYIYLDVLKAICGDTKGKSMIDLCCNLSPYTNQLNFAKRTYVDILPRTLDNKGEQQYFIQDDVLRFLQNKNIHYDVSIASDAAEHMTEMDGVKLLILMELRSDKQILFTPLGEYMVEHDNYNPEAHHSAWTPELTPDYASIVFPKYHKLLNIGAYFFFKCHNLEEEFERVKAELKTKSWTK
jgi:hypothetical protein